MYGIPKNFDPGRFAGRTLESLSVGQHVVALVFSANCTINIEGQIAINSGNAVEVPASLLQLYPLINKDVSSALATEKGTLTLAFADGTELHIFDSNRNFESYNFSFDGKELFIV